MKKTLMMSVLFLFCFATMASAQARVNGRVTGPDGKPIEGAKVIFSNPKAPEGAVQPIMTDKKGKWAALLPIGGQWNIDIEKEGYITSRGSLQISEVARTPTLKTELEPMPQPKEVEEVPSVVPEAQTAVDTGLALMKEEKWAEAAAEFEKAHELLPDNVQVKQVLAKAYHGMGKEKESIQLLREVHEAQPENVGVMLLLTNVLLEDGKLDEGKAMLAQIPDSALTDPTAMINVAILFMNKGNHEDALSYLDRAEKIDPTRGETYYYRGLIHLQQGNDLIGEKKTKDAKPYFEQAKADFEKLEEVAPDSPEASEAKDMMSSIDEQLKRMK